MQQYAVTHQSIVRFLSTPAAHGDASISVDVLETPTSWVFMADRFAYKLKKPIKSRLRDCRVAAARMEACRDELFANRRYSPEVYISITPVYRSEQGDLSLSSEGTVVEWLLKMKRLRAESALQHLMTEKCDFSPTRLATWLVATLADQPPALLSADEFANGLARTAAEYRERLHELGISSGNTGQIYHAQLTFVESNESLFQQRVCDGRVIDGHGDLRSSHVFIDGPPSIIGCLDNNEPHRISDVISDFANLAVECDALGQHDLGAGFVAQYSRQRADPVPTELVNFYKSFHAIGRTLRIAAERRIVGSDGTSTTNRVSHELARAIEYAQGSINH